MTRILIWSTGKWVAAQRNAYYTRYGHKTAAESVGLRGKAARDAAAKARRNVEAARAKAATLKWQALASNGGSSSAAAQSQLAEPGPNTLTPDQVDKLESIPGFEWWVTSNSRWHAMCTLLEEYVREFGHPNVSQRLSPAARAK